jgi:hypothetical protein
LLATERGVAGVKAGLRDWKTTLSRKPEVADFSRRPSERAGKRTVMETHKRPKSAQKIIRHFLDLEDALVEREEQSQ